MDSGNLMNNWNILKRKISALLIVSMLFSNLIHLKLYANDIKFDYQYVPEIEVENTAIDDGMFYMPYGAFNVDEKSEKSKYVFKVLRKGNAEKAEKVRLTMVDASAKYDKDYSIRVIDKLWFSENVHNKYVAKSMAEYMSSTDYEEYNFSDAIIDGSIMPEDIMTEKEKENYVISDEDKEKVLKDAKNIMDEVGLDGKIDRIDGAVEQNKEEEQTTEAQSTEQSVSGFTNTDTQETTTKEESTTEEVTTTEEESTTEEETTTEGVTITEEETTKDESTTEEQSTTETTIDITTTTTTKVETTKIEQATTIEASENTDTSDSAKANADKLKTIASESEIIYGTEQVQYEIKKSTMSLVDGFEMATGLKDDRKRVLPNRDNMDILGFNPNSLEDKTYLNEGIEAVEEELKSAYVVLEFAEGQKEKLIELSIYNDNKYRGDRQSAFNLSPEEGSMVAGVYSSMTMIIHDDEEEEPSYINFVDSTYEPNDGYFTVTVERTGAVAGIATCMIDSEDITAKAGRDYSKVHAKLIFGFGVNTRKIKIPMVSYFADNALKFKLKLQLPEGALIGDNGTTTCTIKRTDKTFKYVEDKLSDSSNNVFGNGITIDTDQIDPNQTGVVFGGPKTDIDMDSIVTGQVLQLEDYLAYWGSDGCNSNSYHRLIDEGKGYQVYLDNDSVWGEQADMSFDFNFDKGEKDILGYQLDWSCNKGNADIRVGHYVTGNGDMRFNVMYKDYQRTWEHEKRNFIFDNKKRNADIEFLIVRYSGCWRKSPKITIHSAKPIYRMYNVTLLESVVPPLIDDNGNLTNVNDYAQYAEVEFDGAKTDRSVVAYRYKPITIKLKNTINNPFYIKNLYIKNTTTGKSRIITSNKNTSATTILYGMFEDFAKENDEFIESVERQGGGWNGKYSLFVELGVKPAKVRLVNDDRVDVKIWGTNPTGSTEEKDGSVTSDWTYNIGDVLHFTATVKPQYASIFKCDGLNIFREEPYSPEWITIRRPTDASDYFPLNAEYSKIKVVPSLSENNNHIVVRLKKDLRDNFDTSYGFFTYATMIENGDYYDYYITDDNSTITGKYFNIKARCFDNNYSPVWQEAFKENIKYMQNDYYFLGSEQLKDNVLYLTCEAGDSIDYSISGSAYYEETPIGGKTIDRYWQAASNIGVVVDNTRFAYSDNDGYFATIPGKGKSGYYQKIKIVSYGVEKYHIVQLNQNHRVTKQYVIHYQDGDRTLTKEVYDVNIDEILISNINNTHPHIRGVTVNDLNGGVVSAINSAIYINDRATMLQANVQPKKADGSYYTYTYEDENGNEIVANEQVKRVEFLVVDMKSHDIKKVIQATRSNADKTTWTATYTFERGRYSEYMSGDKLYVRIVTDRKVGDGKGYDDETGTRMDVPIFNETTYQAISTIVPFIEEAEQEPILVEIGFPSEVGGSYQLPLLGDLACMVNALGLSFGIAMDGDRVRLFIGKKFNGGGNRFDGNGKWVSDTGSAVGISNFKEGLTDMKNFIKNSGTKRAKTMTLGIPSWAFEPIVGIYLEFMLYYDPQGYVQTRFEFTGGGGYLGAILDLQYTFYFLVYGIPVYVGGNVNISFVNEFGLATDVDTHIVLNDPTQSFIDGLIENTHFEFLIRSILYAQAYVGVGIANCIGVRGGFMLRLMFIHNPYVHKKYHNVRSVGFAVDGYIRIWIDAVLLSIPIPIYNFPNFYKMGYFKDIETYEQETGGIPIFGATRDDNNKSNAKRELKPKPRPEVESTFVANQHKMPFGKGIFGGTYVEDGTQTLVENVYDSSEPKFIKYAQSGGFINKGLLVYLDDDQSRGDLDRTVLRYTIYNADTETWTTPQNVWEGNATADFSPTLCDYGDKILLAWASRPDTVDEDEPQAADLLKKMEIWTAFFDCATEQFESVTRITNDDSYDYYPQLVKDDTSNKIYLYYLKNGNVTDITDGDDLINNVQTEVNGAQLMYMLYDNPDGTGYRWLRDYYYDYELRPDITPEEKQEFINTWHGQRFVDMSINIGGDTPSIDNPNFSDYAISSSRIIVANEDEKAELQEIYENHNAGLISDAEFFYQVMQYIYLHSKTYNVVAYSVEEDGDVDTKNDTEIYVKVKSATTSYTVRVTNNDVPDTMPKILQMTDKTYLFWIQNEKAIKMTTIDELVDKANAEDHASSEIITGSVDIMTTDKIVKGDKISNFYPFEGFDNIYIAWQENSNEIDYENFDPSAESSFKQDLYVSGLVKSETNEGKEVKSWSNPVRFTNNGKVNDLPATVALHGKLVLVNNQYNLTSVEDGETYEITNSNLTAMIYKQQSSLIISDVNCDLVETYDNGNKKYRVYIYLNNEGLFNAKGYNFDGSITYDGNSLINISGDSEDYVIPGGKTRIGGYSIVSSLSNVTSPIYVTLTPDQQKHLDKLKVTLYVDEKSIVGSTTGVTSSKDLFDIKEEYQFVVEESENEKESYGNLRVNQVGDTFIVEGVLLNTGNSDSLGNEKIYVIDQANWESPIASSSYIDMKAGTQLQFAIPIDKSVLEGVTNGVKDLVLYVANDDGKVFSTYEFATINAKVPYDFKVNGSDEDITIKVGESLELTSTYEPSERYKNAKVLYSSNNSEIATVISDKLTGVATGSTVLTLTTKEFGGSKSINVNVLPADPVDPTPSPTPGPGPRGGGGGGSSGGAGAAPAADAPAPTTTEVPIVKTIAGWTDETSSTWIYDPIQSKFKLVISQDGKTIQAVNGFYAIDKIVNQAVAGNQVPVKITNTYYFDAYGNMTTGWVKTVDNKWYFFENAKTIDEGKMIVGWKQILNDWYYFGYDGTMYVDTVTPDGYRVGIDGKWHK